MSSRIAVCIAGITLCGTAIAFHPQDLRNSFEWGEYQHLIDALEPYLAASPDSLSSEKRAAYHTFLGVAYFGKGRVSDARKQFLSALTLDTSIRLDSTYVSEEMRELFTAVRSELLEQRRAAHVEDSIRTVKQQAFEANLRAIREEELRKTRRTNSLLALSFMGLGAVFTAAAVYEYTTYRDPYHEFRKAAGEGDRLTYDRLRPQLRRANGITVGCTVAACLSEAAGITFVIRTVRLKRSRT